MKQATDGQTHYPAMVAPVNHIEPPHAVFGDTWEVRPSSTLLGRSMCGSGPPTPSTSSRSPTSPRRHSSTSGTPSASETLDTYSHLWPDSEDRTRLAVDGVLGISRGAAAEREGTSGVETPG
jgi:hypothetical protein